MYHGDFGIRWPNRYVLGALKLAPLQSAAALLRRRLYRRRNKGKVTFEEEKALQFEVLNAARLSRESRKRFKQEFNSVEEDVPVMCSHILTVLEDVCDKVIQGQTMTREAIVEGQTHTQNEILKGQAAQRQQMEATVLELTTPRSVVGKPRFGLDALNEMSAPEKTPGRGLLPRTIRRSSSTLKRWSCSRALSRS